MSDPMDYIDLELEYYASLKKLPKTDAQWLEIFPEAKPLVKKKNQEVLVLCKTREAELKKQIQEIKNKYSTTPPTEHNNLDWFKEVLEKKLLEIQTQIKKTRYALNDNPLLNGSITEQDKEQAREIPITGFVECKRLGRNFVTLCIFHNDTKPSLTIFPNNKFKCFACDAYGDSIDFVQKLNNLDFIQAIRWMLNK